MFIYVRMVYLYEINEFTDIELEEKYFQWKNAEEQYAQWKQTKFCILFLFIQLTQQHLLK